MVADGVLAVSGTPHLFVQGVAAGLPPVVGTVATRRSATSPPCLVMPPVPQRVNVR